jgi:predicted branched-subunit amino acid permease
VSDPEAARRQIAAGARAAIPVGLAAAVLGISFGVIARPVLGPVAAVVMSMIVFGGSAQFAATAVLAGGGGALAAVAAGLLLNVRFLPMGVAVAPWLSGGRLSRALKGQAVVDPSWALAHRGGGRFDPHLLLGATLPQYPAWVGGTVIGVLGGGLMGDPGRLGLDAIFPAFFLALLAAELSDSRARWAAVAAVGVALALVPFTPPGVPVIAASAAALLGLGRR